MMVATEDREISVRDAVDVMIDSPGWGIFLRGEVFPLLMKVRKTLLTNSSLTDVQRGENIAVLTEVRALLRRIYVLAGAKLPKEIDEFAS